MQFICLRTINVGFGILCFKLFGINISSGACARNWPLRIIVYVGLGIITSYGIAIVSINRLLLDRDTYITPVASSSASHNLLCDVLRSSGAWVVIENTWSGEARDSLELSEFPHWFDPIEFTSSCETLANDNRMVYQEFGCGWPVHSMIGSWVIEFDTSWSFYAIDTYDTLVISPMADADARPFMLCVPLRPASGIVVSVVFYAIIVACAHFLFEIFRFNVRNSREVRGCCSDCGHQLIIGQNVCPECGMNISCEVDTARRS